MGYWNFSNRTLISRTFATGENLEVYWQNSTALSPIGEIPEGLLAKVQWNFAIGESLIGESRNPHNHCHYHFRFRNVLWQVFCSRVLLKLLLHLILEAVGYLNKHMESKFVKQEAIEWSSPGIPWSMITDNRIFSRNFAVYGTKTGRISP
jgi:hypothetical protein